jgi:hypothetical protein
MGRAYKDSLFRSLFGEERAFISLYNAITGSDYGADTQVEINTLGDTLFTGRKNDVSAIIDGRLVIVTEHQSTVNENMPFRFLLHIVRLLENAVKDKAAVYRKKLVKLPRPVFIVLYNGLDDCGDLMTMRLSDAFEQAGGCTDVNMELVVKFVNINKGRNGEIVRKCEPLEGYVEFVDIARKARERMLKGNPEINREAALEAAVSEAVAYCKEHGILKDFFEKLKPEEVNMLATEWKLEDALVVEREEGWEDGFEDGIEKGRNDIARKALSKGLAADVIRDLTGLSVEDIVKLRNEK